MSKIVTHDDFTSSFERALDTSTKNDVVRIVGLINEKLVELKNSFNEGTVKYDALKARKFTMTFNMYSGNDIPRDIMLWKEAVTTFNNAGYDMSCFFTYADRDDVSSTDRMNVEIILKPLAK
jgi:hypothetical protein